MNKAARGKPHIEWEPKTVEGRRLPDGRTRSKSYGRIRLRPREREGRRLCKSTQGLRPHKGATSELEGPHAPNDRIRPNPVAKAARGTPTAAQPVFDRAECGRDEHSLWGRRRRDRAAGEGSHTRVWRSHKSYGRRTSTYGQRPNTAIHAIGPHLRLHTTQPRTSVCKRGKGGDKRMRDTATGPPAADHTAARHRGPHTRI